MTIATSQPPTTSPETISMTNTPLPKSNPLPTSQHSNRKKDQGLAREPPVNVPSSTPSPPHMEDNRSMQRSHSTHQPRRSDSLHRKASNISNRNAGAASGDGARAPQELQRRSSESRKQAIRIQNYVIYRKTIGQGSMGKVKLAECLTDRDQQKVGW